jgi:hypothetical protein
MQLITDTQVTAENVAGVLAGITGVLTVADSLSAEQLSAVVLALGSVVEVSDALSAEQLTATLNQIAQLAALENINAEQRTALGGMLNSILSIETLTDEQRTSAEAILGTLGGTLVMKDEDSPQHLELLGELLGVMIGLDGLTDIQRATLEDMLAALQGPLSVENQHLANLDALPEMPESIRMPINTRIGELGDGVDQGLTDVESGVSSLGRGIDTGLDSLDTGISSGLEGLRHGIDDQVADLNTAVDGFEARMADLLAITSDAVASVQATASSTESRSRTIQSTVLGIDTRSGQILNNTAYFGDVEATVSQVVARIEDISGQIYSGFEDVLGALGDVPQAARGAFVEEDGLFYVHANERILTAQETAAYHQIGGIDGMRRRADRPRLQPRNGAPPFLPGSANDLFESRALLRMTSPIDRMPHDLPTRPPTTEAFLYDRPAYEPTISPAPGGGVRPMEAPWDPTPIVRAVERTGKEGRDDERLLRQLMLARLNQEEVAKAEFGKLIAEVKGLREDLRKNTARKPAGGAN